MAADSESSGMKSFQNSSSKSSQSMKWRWLAFASRLNSWVAQRLARPVFMYDMAQMILVRSSSKASGQMRM